MLTIKFIKYGIILVALLFVTFIIFLYLIGRSPISFGPGVQDFSMKLPNGYTLHRTSAHMISVTPDDGWDSESQMIPPKILEIDWDKEFVIVKRQGLKRRSPSNPNDTYEIPDPEVFDYWILNTKIPIVYGPLDPDEFISKRKELKVPENLSLKSIYEMKKKFN